MAVEEKRARVVVGSEAWFEKVFSVMAESEGAKRAAERLAVEGRESELRRVVEDWVGTQAFFFLTEFGAGKRLSLQPTYQAELVEEADGLRVFAFNLSEYGDQKESYVSFDGIDESVREGLARVYGCLYGLDEGEGLMRVSPSEFYKDFGSYYDVLEFYRVKRVGEGRKVIEGRYLVLDGMLSREERMFVANWHGGSESVERLRETGGEWVDYSIESLVMNPQRFGYGGSGEDVVLEHIQGLNQVFAMRFGRELVGKTDLDMYDKIRKRVAENVVELVDSLVDGDKQSFVKRLRAMMFDSQREWAVDNDFDPDEVVRMIMDGRLLIGFEFGDWREPSWSDPAADKWYGMTSSESGYCRRHKVNHYDFGCPECLIERSLKAV